jgi:hypothetical protein
MFLVFSFTILISGCATTPMLYSEAKQVPQNRLIAKYKLG